MNRTKQKVAPGRAGNDQWREKENEVTERAI